MKSNIENAELQQVTDGGTLQSRGSYLLADGSLQIFRFNYLEILFKIPHS